MQDSDFKAAFTALTADGDERHPPFKWQTRLYRRFLDCVPPSTVDVPTGLGKTAVMALWLIAKASGAAALPRQLVYVVDRRAVVDQATRFAEQLRANIKTEMPLEFAKRLGLGSDRALPISTLRGGFTDNRDWLEDPGKPAVVVGTVDMIGSRLLFQGYGVSRRMRPFHAGLLGVDALVVLDEAHLCPPFEGLLREIARERTGILGPKPGTSASGVVPPFRVMSLSATGQENVSETTGTFKFQDDDKEDDSTARERYTARKRLTVHEFDAESPETKKEDKKKPDRLATEISERARNLSTADAPTRVLVYCDRRTDAEKVKKKIESRMKASKTPREIEMLVGGRRVRERENIATWLKEHGFVGGVDAPPDRPTFLIATAAGEVGVDLNADHLVCDLVEWERMQQRFGRVNRRGKGDARIEVVAAPRSKEKKEEWPARLERLREPLTALRPAARQEAFGENRTGEAQTTQSFMDDGKGSAEQGAAEQLPLQIETRDDCDPRDASPAGLADLKNRAAANPALQKRVAEAKTPAPLRPALTRPLVDNWSMTSLDDDPARARIEPWLRGWEQGEPQTKVVWRAHLPVKDDGAEAGAKEVEAFFEAAPPHATEILETETSRVLRWMMDRAKKLVDQKDESETPEGEHSETDGADSEARPLTRTGTAAYVLTSRRKLQRTLTLRKLHSESKGDRKLKEQVLPGATVVFDARFAGLASDGMLDAAAEAPPPTVDGETEDWMPEADDKPVVRFRVRRARSDDTQEPDKHWRERHRFVTDRTGNGEEQEWLSVEKWKHDSATGNDGSIGRLQELKEHHACTEKKAEALAKAAGLVSPHDTVLAVAARHHDDGKGARRWQRAAAAPRDDRIYAKTGQMFPERLNGYRHEFGSLPSVQQDEGFKRLPADLQNLTLHLVAAHHGHARPAIRADGCDEPPPVSENRAREVMVRFARLQKTWGPWGLAWWESLLRAADHQASRDNEAAERDTDKGTSTGEEKP